MLAIASLLSVTLSDKEAFKVLFEHFAPRVKGYMLKLGTENSLADELAQPLMACSALRETVKVSCGLVSCHPHIAP